MAMIALDDYSDSSAVPISVISETSERPLEFKLNKVDKYRDVDGSN